jgi:hypothetical protein
MYELLRINFELFYQEKLEILRIDLYELVNQSRLIFSIRLTFAEEKKRIVV